MPATNLAVSAANIVYASCDLCAVVLCATVLVNFLLSKKIVNRNNRLFLAMLCFGLGSALVNTLSIICISVVSAPLWLVNLSVSINYLVYNLTGVVFVVYAVSVIYEFQKIPRACYAVANAVFSVSVVGAVYAVVCVFKYGYFGVPAAHKLAYELILYITQICAFLFSFIIALCKYKKLTRRGLFNICVFAWLNIIASALQLALRVQISNFALAVAMLLIYVALQRPEDSIDAVSGAFNPHTFARIGNSRIASNKHFYVFALEINNITLVNSSFGLSGGNQVLREVADRIKSCLGKMQYLYRLSGARFAVIFDSLSEYGQFAPMYKGVFGDPVAVSGTEIKLTATACLIEFPQVTDKLSETEDLLRYYRKSVKATENVIIADATALDKARRRELVDYAIQSAINDRAFEVYFQPIYSVKDKAFNGCEALIRLKDRNLGFISPDEFIPIAEQNGKIIEVGRFVIDEVCRFIWRSKLQKLGIKFVDINLSVIQCMHPEIIDDINGTLEKYHVPRSMVNLEITETASAQSYALLQSKLNELHSNGFTISLDDFGTGFASVEYLINFPFDVVKLDKSLVWAYMSTKKYEPILQHYMPMLHSLGTKIVAEGVETEEMVKALSDLGCDYLQGYYYSKPIPEEQFIKFIEKNNGAENIA